MKKISLLSLLILSFHLFACSDKVYPLKGNYPPTPIIYYSSQSVDKVWDNIIDLFAQQGLSIRIIDRSSGLIISDKIRLHWSQEDKDGKLKTPSADVALPKIYDRTVGHYSTPTNVTGEWNIRIKAVEGKTSINVNLLNIQASFSATNPTTYATATYQGQPVNGKSTGNFEKTIYEIVK